MPERDAMNDSNPSCANCGAALPAADAICKPCEREIMQSLADPTRGKHRCPGCTSRFDEPMLDWLPRNVPWYRFQAQKLRCPYCKIFLRDRRLVATPSQQLIATALFFFLMVSSFFRLPKAARLAFLCLLIALWVVEVVRWWRARSSFAAEDRYLASEVSAT